VHGAIARARPPDPALPHRPARQLLTLSHELDHDLARGPKPPPERENALDRVPTCSSGHSTIRPSSSRSRPTGSASRTSPRAALLRSPPSNRADQVRLGLVHRALEAQQEAVVEVTRGIDAVGVSDQRACQRAQIQQPVPVRRRARQSRGLQRQDQPKMTETDLRDQLTETQPHRSTRPSGRCPRQRQQPTGGQPSSTAAPKGRMPPSVRVPALAGSVAGFDDRTAAWSRHRGSCASSL
jgi:hypothetical protein